MDLKGVFAKNKRGYRLTALLIATKLTSICCVCKEKIEVYCTLIGGSSAAYMNFRINLTLFYINFLRQEHKI